ncbi:hypothetical protein ACED56_22135 [Vibrio splendidus]|uniref:Uncharacterized protein n=1 Tax=Vibrio splendidus TaxID=29497 RepID=A0ABD5AF47_VIBSP|nr:MULTISPECIES: hypothetical protein [Vibrio]MBO7913469.1 hypothetical protein [Vibrio sp. G41H]MCF7490503.1 hypothetical protein [Vibrio sp. G-C-1]MCW4444039.1 hypothetical protein [Vibrio splendidus]MDP2491587.1 hypothetical protein [Vibrio splendidus]
MKWFGSNLMGKFIRKLLGIEELASDTAQYEITPDMANPDTVKMNITSFRNSEAVQAELKAAQQLYRS